MNPRTALAWAAVNLAGCALFSWVTGGTGIFSGAIGVFFLGMACQGYLTRGR